MDERYWQKKYNELFSDYTAIASQLEQVTLLYSEVIEENSQMKRKIEKFENKAVDFRASAMVSEIMKTSLMCSSISIKKQRPNRMFEEFSIIGPNSQKVPETLLQYPKTTSFPDKEMFPFPSGFNPRTVDLSISGTAIFELYYPRYEKNYKSFVFCMKSPEVCSKLDLPDLPNNTREILYGCCVIDFDLIPYENDYTATAVPFCYCLLSYIPCFDVHFEVLYSILSIKKANNLEGETRSDRSLLKEQKKLLKCYYKHFFIASERSLDVHLPTVRTVLSLPEDLSYIDSDWACPLMFSLLTIDEFFQLIFALATERSIVFMSSNLCYISSCVLGLVSLLKPFKWPFVMSPILPESLYIALEAPVPIIAGVSQQTYIDPENIICVRLDSSNQPKITGEKVIEPFANDIKNYVRAPYEKFNHICYTPSDEQVDACRRIAYEIRQFWNQIIGRISCKSTIGEAKLNVMKGSNNSRDINFLRELVNTQIFAYMVDELN